MVNRLETAEIPSEFALIQIIFKGKDGGKIVNNFLFINRGRMPGELTSSNFLYADQCLVVFDDGRTAIIDGGRIEYAKVVLNIKQGRIQHLIYPTEDKRELIILNQELERYGVNNQKTFPLQPNRGTTEINYERAGKGNFRYRFTTNQALELFETISRQGIN